MHCRGSQLLFAGAVRQAAAGASSAGAAADLGALPEWRLDDLYAGMDSPDFAADLSRAAADAKRFRRGLSRQARRLSPGRRTPASASREAVRAYEALQDLVGRIMSYAVLVYAGDTSDPARAKFYGDAQEKVTELAGDLLFFELELNRLDDALLDAAMAELAAGALSALARGHPQGAPAPARRRDRAIVPRKVVSAAPPPGTGCSTRRSPRCASSSRARS